MQLASGFMQLASGFIVAAAGCRRNILYFTGFFRKIKNVTNIVEWGSNHFQKKYLGKISLSCAGAILKNRFVFERCFPAETMGKIYIVRYSFRNNVLRFCRSMYHIQNQNINFGIYGQKSRFTVPLARRPMPNGIPNS